MSLFGASKRWHPMKKASCICIRIPDQLQIGTFNKNNWRKLEASELDVSVQTAYVGNRIISHLATGWSAGIYNTCKAIVMDIDPIGLSMPMFTVKADRWEVLLHSVYPTKNSQANGIKNSISTQISRQIICYVLQLKSSFLNRMTMHSFFYSSIIHISYVINA